MTSRPAAALAATVLANGGAAPAAAAPRYAPIDQPGPALTTDPAKLEASLTCTGDDVLVPELGFPQVGAGPRQDAASVTSPAHCAHHRRVRLPRIRAGERPKELRLRVAVRARSAVRGTALRRLIRRGYVTVELPATAKRVRAEGCSKTRDGRTVRVRRTFMPCNGRRIAR